MPASQAIEFRLSKQWVRGILPHVDRKTSVGDNRSNEGSLTDRISLTGARERGSSAPVAPRQLHLNICWGHACIGEEDDRVEEQVGHLVGQLLAGAVLRGDDDL